MPKKSRIKPIFNPFSPSSSHGKKEQKKTALFCLIIVAMIWFLTPISTLIAQFILMNIDVQDDIILGVESYREIRNTYPIVQDTWGVRDIGKQLVARTTLSNAFCASTALDVKKCTDQVRQYQWSFEVVSSPEVNAFALPGGIIRVTNSLLNQLQLTRGEIAALLGHEIGHVLHRHSQARLLKGQLVQTILKALVYEDGDDYEESFGEAVTEILISSAKFLGNMRFSRQDEYEADNTAFDILVNSDMYDPRAVQTLLEKLWTLSDGNSDKNSKQSVLEFMNGWDKTHPGTEDRIKEMQKRWSSLAKSEKRKFYGLQR
ncbi:hypothetical protein CTEN210_15224 [Chaetoceros tenuissimus]|uniref:Peptidase M48 domain-containing protein n=1 Tax=Chaetoceros tenuissimus TaxID=426638 RepID=A0AAD3D6J7_9STRA|nr:hypothetical protein CTEN210_15224 [Chaetoceros tenuissimus]